MPDPLTHCTRLGNRTRDSAGTQATTVGSHCGAVAQGSSAAIAAVQVAMAAQIPSPDWELSYATGAAKKKKQIFEELNI